MAAKKNNYDADYDRWGAAPGAIKVTKAKKSSQTKTAKKAGKKSK